MKENILDKTADDFFDKAIKLASRFSKLEKLQTILQQSRQRLHEPMRVAIVGLIKAGKSTMMNALLGEAVVATGRVEATFNVNWLKYGKESSLLVHFKDNSLPEQKSFEELEQLTLRAEENRDYLLRIKYIEVFHDNEILKIINLIDTPGLQSFYKDDSDNTKEFLSIHGNELSEITNAQTSKADAILFMFSQSVHAAEMDIAKQFQGSAVNPSPINAIGVLTKIELNYPSVEADLLELGCKICTRLRENPKMRRLFYTVYPTAGLLAFGAKTMTAEEFEILRKLASLPEDRFEDIVSNIKKLTERNYEDVSVSPEDREKLYKRMGQYGIWLAGRFIREGIEEFEELCEKLYSRSGLPELTELITSHFGNRANLIKLSSGFKQIQRVCFQERQKLSGDERETIDEIAGMIEEIETSELAFQQLGVLRDYYEGKLEFTGEEILQLEAITGEKGRSLGERLGLAANASLEDMLTEADRQHRHWKYKVYDFGSINAETRRASQVLSLSCEQIIFNLHKIKHYLYI